MRKHTPQEAFDICERMERDIARIDALIEQLLTLSRLEAGLSLEKERTLTSPCWFKSRGRREFRSSVPGQVGEPGINRVPWSWKRWIPSRCERV